jgi:hypothetical protein
MIGAILGSLVSPWLVSRLGHRALRREAFNRAIAAVRAAQVVRHRPTEVPADYLGGDENVTEKFNEQLREKGLNRFFDAQHEARLALALLEPYYSVRDSDDSWEISGERAEALLRELKKAR